MRIQWLSHVPTRFISPFHLHSRTCGGMLRRAGVKHNHWFLPACQSLYLTQEGPVVSQGTPLLCGAADVPKFNRDALVPALRTDQAGKSTFPEFLLACWHARVVRYDVDFTATHMHVFRV